VTAPIRSEQQGNARITVYFDSPINAGSITVAVDGETISEIPFDHTKKGFLGFKTEGRGVIKRVLLAPAGRRRVAVTLVDRKRGVIGSRTFEARLPTSSEWTLKIDLSVRGGEPNFTLTRVDG